MTQIDTSFWDGEGWKIAYEDVSTPYEGPIELIDDCTEEGPDGYVDLVIKIPGVFFCAPDGQVGYITVGGELLDGTPFTTTPDVVTIINKKVDCPV